MDAKYRGDQVASSKRIGAEACFSERFILYVAAVLATALSGSNPAFGDTPYCRLTTDRITVIASGSVKRCSKLAAQFVHYERLVRDLAAIDEDAQLPPLAVYSLAESDARRVFLSEADKREQKGKGMRIYSKFLPSHDVNVAAIVEAGGDDHPLQSILLLYGQGIVTGRTARAYPLWYQIGVPNLTNGLVIRDDGSVLLSRDMPFEPVVEENKGVKYSLAGLLEETGRTFSNGGNYKEFSLRAREWAKFGLLTTPERRAQYRDLALLMRQGQSAEEAANQVFGVSLAQLSEEFEDGRWRKQVQYKVAAPGEPLTLPAAEPIGAAKTAELLQLVADRVAKTPMR